MRYYFPADGEYLFEMRPRENGVSGGFEGITAEPHQLYVSLDNIRVWTGTIGGPEFARPLVEPVLLRYGSDDRDKKVTESLRFTVPVKAGLHLVQVYFVAKTSAYLEDLFDRSVHREPYRKGNGQPNISTVTITGPQPGTAAVSEVAKPSQGVDVHAARRRKRGGPLREEDHLDAGAGRVPAAGHRARTCRYCWPHIAMGAARRV